MRSDIWSPGGRLVMTRGIISQTGRDVPGTPGGAARTSLATLQGVAARMLMMLCAEAQANVPVLYYTPVAGSCISM